MEEIITGTTEIFDGRIVKLSVHDVRLPNDGSSKREVVYHPGAVAVVALDEEQKIFLVRQYRLPARQITYELPAGTLDDGEKPEDCAYREMQEETGYKPTQLESLGGIYTAPGYTTEFIHIFYSPAVTASSLEPDVDEFVEMVRIPFKDALAMVERGEIQDSKSVTGILRVARRLGL